MIANMSVNHILVLQLLLLASFTTRKYIHHHVLRTIDGFVLSVDSAALLEDRSFASPSTNRATIHR